VRAPLEDGAVVAARADDARIVGGEAHVLDVARVAFETAKLRRVYEAAGFVLRVAGAALALKGQLNASKGSQERGLARLCFGS
jgi:hypothetical protein